jgi:hypothetical protein
MSDVEGLPSRPAPGVRGSLREVGLIVAGVLIALGLEAAWQYRVDRADERDLLDALASEFHENTIALDRWIGLHQQVASGVEGLIDHLESASEGTTVSVPDSLVGMIGRSPTFDPELNMLDAAVSSGRISLVRSAEVQRALASWSRSLADAQEEEQRAAEQLYRELLPLLGEATDIGRAYAWLSQDVRDVMRGGPGIERLQSSAPMRVDQRLVNALWVRHRLTRSAENELQILRAYLDEVLALISGAPSG